MIEDRCYSVSTDELLTLEGITNHFAEVEIADRKEVESFVTNKCFKLNQRDSRAYNRIDGTWVRKWLNRKLGTVKSRCCARGFLDRQKKYLNKHSSTASRLSHRLACAPGVQYALMLGSFDVKTALL